MLDGDIFKPLVILAGLSWVTIPLAIWKLIDILIWIFTHIKITI